MPSPFDNAKRIIVFIVNSLSSPPTNWDKSETAARYRGHSCSSRRARPIDAFSFEASSS
jgi:NTE family protein